MTVQIGDIGRAVRETAYAVRGPIVARAQELERQGREIVYCNIGNPHALEQRPLTWIRQILALCEYPELMDRMPEGLIPADAVAMARQILGECRHGTGAYTDSKGYLFVREAIADFIRRRDGIQADPEAIYLTDGASKGVRAVLRMLVDGRRDGILIPTPQYPLYSATITLYDGSQIPYPLDEASGWKLTRAGLERAYHDAVRADIRPRAVCVINPGNPSGAVLDEGNVAMVLDFARERGLSVLADEVYQENVYREGDRFVSFASLLDRKGYRDVSLFSFHSTSKGLLGECGQRGGYLECRNVPAEVMEEITKFQSVSLCANTAGQIVTFLMVTPPRPGEPSFEQHERERREILESLALRAGIVERGLNRVDGIHCNPVTGAMYAFPRIELPEGVTDEEYCLALLEETGICVVPGSGFGQAPGTAHFRITTLPPAEKLEVVVALIGDFHARFCARLRRTG